MFGGVAFLHHGNLCCGVVRQRLMARVGPDQYLDALGLPHASEMDFTGRPLRGMVYVGPEGCGTGAELAAWLDRCESFVAELPPK
ncbi:MAG: TfoX/Sxy family protein [Planctomycetes bacterium]|nr:TfoX/Sxy family protein [Planctomycetota bacterium]